MFAFVLAGCGSAAGPGDGQPYATLVGTIQSALTDLHHPVRAAVVWGGGDVTFVHVSQDFSVAGNFPAQFTLPLTELPPKEAMHAAGPGAAWAGGTLVVYEDLNDNGKLDLVSLQQPATDRIVGTLTDTALIYGEGDVVQHCPAGGCPFSYHRGFNLVATGHATPNPMRACEPHCPWTEPVWSELPLTSQLSITLTGSPALTSFMCQTDPSQMGSGTTTPSLPPSGAEVFCAADGTAYEYRSCQVPATPCGATSCEYGWGTRDPANPLPAGWPCH